MQQQELNRLLQLRVQTFRWDVQANTGAAQSDQYFYTLITAWHSMYLVPAGDLFYLQNLIATLEASPGVRSLRIPKQIDLRSC